MLRAVASSSHALPLGRRSFAAVASSSSSSSSSWTDAGRIRGRRRTGNGDAYEHGQQQHNQHRFRWSSRRPMSTNSSTAGGATGSSSSSSATVYGEETPVPSFDESASKMLPSLGSKPISPEPSAASSAPDVVSDAASQASAAAASSSAEALAWDPSWYWGSDHAINLLRFVHETTGMPYAATIAVTTLGLRVLLFPVFVKGQQNTSRMAHMNPEMAVLKDRMDRLTEEQKADPELQMKMAGQFKALFKKYDCNPLKSLVVPFIQAPVFVSMFFGLRKMPDYFPTDLATGGALWFPDLTAADPLHILPVVSAGAFLAMIELGKDQMTSSNPQQGRTMLTVMRALGVIMIPATMQFSTAILCYWSTNNTLSLLQAALFRNASVRKALGIWDPPKPVPGAAPTKGVMEQVNDMFAKGKKKDDALSMAEKIKEHNAKIDAAKEGKGVAGRKGRRRTGGRAK